MGSHNATYPIYFRPRRLQNSLGFLAEKERKTPLELWSCFDAEIYEETLVVTAPKGRRFDVPRNVSSNSEFISYKLKLKRISSSKVEVTRTLILKKTLLRWKIFKKSKHK